MPLGQIDEDRADRFLPLTAVLDTLRQEFDLVPDSHHSTGGPARYWRLAGTGTRLGLISPLTGNFCATCNRVRLSTDGKLHMCLGHEDSVDLKAAIRAGGLAAVDDRITEALALKPAAHDFRIERGAAPAVARHMSVTGG
jgi:cyclic pyranopterin phosphate synthase